MSSHNFKLILVNLILFSLSNNNAEAAPAKRVRYRNCITPAGAVGIRKNKCRIDETPLSLKAISQSVAATTIPGEQGIAGEQGAAGPQGPAGQTGAAGPQGPIGLTGPQGPVGPKGDKGDTGAIGPQGAVGPQGPIGLTGPQGPIGPNGDKGDTGAIGPQGDVGPQGPIGMTGPQGPKGDTGASGYAAVRYVPGPIITPPASGISFTVASYSCSQNEAAVGGSCEAILPQGPGALNANYYLVSSVVKNNGWSCVYQSFIPYPGVTFKATASCISITPPPEN